MTTNIRFTPLSYVLFGICLLASGLMASCGGDSGGSGSEADTNGDPDADTQGPSDTDGGEEGGVGDTAAGCPPFCDDGLACTDGVCEDGGCVFVPKVGFCVVEGACRTTEELNPDNPCLFCSPEVSNTAWSPVPDGLPCNDDNACTLSDACTSGMCTGGAKDCGVAPACAEAVCDVATGACSFAAIDGPCDDGDPCTVGSQCQSGQCGGGSPKCNDEDPCTADSCELGVCSYSSLDCDDDNPCTEDSCAAGQGCEFAPLSGIACEAGNQCLTGDVCAAGVCVEGATPAVCEPDGNPCTDDMCLPSAGCVYAFNSAPCSDGYACTTNDTCAASLCLGDVTGDCSCPTPQFSQVAGEVQKAKTLVVGGNGHPGAGLDVDGDPNTCAPAGDCSGGVDNAMADLSLFLNPTLTDAIEAGAWVTLSELAGANPNGVPFTLRIYGGLPDKVAGPGCDVQSEQCPYQVLPASFGPDCQASLVIPDAVIQGDQLTAGGPGRIMSIGLPIGSGPPVNLLVVDARVQGKVSWAADGKTIENIVGVMGGAVPKVVLFSVLSKLSPSQLGGLSVQDVLNLVEAVLDEDLDLDGDGDPDAASVGLRIETLPGTITGMAEK